MGYGVQRALSFFIYSIDFVQHNTRKVFTFIKNPLMNVKNKMYKNDSRNKRKTA